MKVTKQDLVDQCELIQEDLLCTLDGLDQDLLDAVCQIIVDRMNILKDKFNEPK